MGVCKECRQKAHDTDYKEHVHPRMHVDPIETCDKCGRKYWAETGEPQEPGK